MTAINRRNLIRLGAVLSLAAIGPAAEPALTPPEIQGPFYPLVAQQDRDFDLTLIAGHTERAAGEQIWIRGQVLDQDGRGLEQATVDIWQANTHGRYSHPYDSNPAPLDANFQGWAIVPSGRDGGFVFRTIVPGSYPASDTWTRPPHVHFKISKLGYHELVTQMYFPGQALNATDLLLQNKTAAEQQVMIATDSGTRRDGLRVFDYRVVVARAG